VVEGVVATALLQLATHLLRQLGWELAWIFHHQALKVARQELVESGILGHVVLAPVLGLHLH
jgi:hypothetical protein